MSYMEQKMQDQIEGSIHLQNAICEDALEVYRQDKTMPLDMKMQRDLLFIACEQALWNSLDLPEHVRVLLKSAINKVEGK